MNEMSEHRMCNSLKCEQECLRFVALLEGLSDVRSNSGPEQNI